MADFGRTAGAQFQAGINGAADTGRAAGAQLQAGVATEDIVGRAAGVQFQAGVATEDIVGRAAGVFFQAGLTFPFAGLPPGGARPEGPFIPGERLTKQRVIMGQRLKRHRGQEP